MPVIVFYPSYWLAITYTCTDIPPLYERNGCLCTSLISTIWLPESPTELVWYAAWIQMPLLYPPAHSTSFPPACHHFVSVAHSQLVFTPDGASLPGLGPAVLGPSLIGQATCSTAAREMIDKCLPQTEPLLPLTFCCWVTAPMVLCSLLMILGMTSLVSLYQTAVLDSWCS